MGEALYRKFRQHRNLRMLLLNTYPYELVYVEQTDAYGEWRGRGPERVRQVACACAITYAARWACKPIRSFILTKPPNQRNEKMGCVRSFLRNIFISHAFS